MYLFHISIAFLGFSTALCHNQNAPTGVYDTLPVEQVKAYEPGMDVSVVENNNLRDCFYPKQGNVFGNFYETNVSSKVCTGEEQEYYKGSFPPRYTFYMSIGYSSLDLGLDYLPRLERDPTKGLDWMGGFEYIFPNRYWGLRLKYQGYSSSYRYYKDFNVINGSMLFSHIMLEIIAKQRIYNTLVISGNFGIGFFGYKEEVLSNGFSFFDKQYSLSFGIAVGLEYLLTDYFGIHLSLGSVMGCFRNSADINRLFANFGFCFHL